MEQDTLTPYQQQIAAMADGLAARFAPRADEYDRDGTFPMENYTDLHQSGYLRMIVPKEYGGDGATLFDIVVAQDHLARGDGATAMAVDMTLHLIGRVDALRSWPEPMFARICRSIVEEGALINAAATESEMGSPSRGGAPATKAIPTDGGWLLTGRKIFVSMAPALRYFVISATTPPAEDAPEGTIINAVVQSGSEGLALEDTWSDALSLRTSGSYDVLLEDVFVSDEWVLDRQIIGGAQKPKSPMQMAWFNLSLSAVYLGIGQAAHDTIVRYACERVPTALGRPIATLPNIQRRVGDMQVRLTAARKILYDTARMWVEHPEAHASMPAHIATAKYLCTNAAVDVSDQALRIAGGFGLTRSLPLERFYRDARAGLTHPPQDDAALELIGRVALGQ